jgi:hypothetical protein
MLQELQLQVQGEPRKPEIGGADRENRRFLINRSSEAKSRDRPLLTDVLGRLHGRKGQAPVASKGNDAALRTARVPSPRHSRLFGRPHGRDGAAGERIRTG